MHSCAPWDGPALRISLPLEKKATYPQLDIAIWKATFPRSATFPESMQNDTGYIGYCSSENTCTYLPSANITFQTEDSGNLVKGTFNVTLTTGEHLQGSYEAVLDVTHRELCG